MSSTVAVQDLKIGMFVRLQLGWMSHPFPLSSFRITSAEQISTIRGLGLKQVTWVPEKSEINEPAATIHVSASAVAEISEAERAAADRRAQRGIL